MIRRRTLLAALVGLALAPVAWLRAGATAGLASLAPALEKTLATSPFVYVSPLLANGAESTCHGEVWFGWIDGSVVLTTAATSWKARSLARGLTRARIWAGDYGRWKQLIGRNEAFRSGPSFVARAARVQGESAIDDLLALYEKKYPAEIGKWRESMRAGQRDGSRVLIRYEPEGSRAGRAGAART